MSNGFDLGTGSFGVDLGGLANSALGFYKTSVDGKIAEGTIRANLVTQQMKNTSLVYLSIAGLLFVLILKNR